MLKVIKIKQSDIMKIANNILEQSGFDDFDTKIQPEELSNDDINATELTLGQDENGVFYIMKNAQNGEPEIIAKSR